MSEMYPVTYQAAPDFLGESSEYVITKLMNTYNVTREAALGTLDLWLKGQGEVYPDIAQAFPFVLHAYNLAQAGHPVLANHELVTDGEKSSADFNPTGDGSVVAATEQADAAADAAAHAASQA